MANIHRGEVSLDAGGRVYTLRLSVNALCDLEGVVQRPATAAIADLVDAGKGANVDFRLARAVIWAAMLGNSPGATLEDAGELIEAAGLGPVMESIGKMITAAFPAPAKATTENPQ